MDVKKAILAHFPWPEAMALLDVLAESGLTREQAVPVVTEILDKALPMEELVPGPAGQLLEKVDGPVIHLALDLLWRFAEDAGARRTRIAARQEVLEAKKAQEAS